MATKTIKTTFKFRRGLASVFASKNIVLADGEPGFELDTNKLKVGNGTTAWNDLDYLTSSNVDYDVVKQNITEAIEEGDISLPIASNEIQGVVISSTEKNKVSVTSDGTMIINTIGIEKLVNTDNIDLILDGGTA